MKHGRKATYRSMVRPHSGASFDSDDDSRFSDTDKFWLTLQAKLE
jgi:hypothetical protein